MRGHRTALLAVLLVAAAGGHWAQSCAAGQTPALDTAAVACDLNLDRDNPELNLHSQARWTCDGGVRRLRANGVPDHATGDFPNAHNPSRIAAKTLHFATTLTPALSGKTTAIAHVIGFALNGVKFDPATAGSCPSAASDMSQCTPVGAIGPWSLEALGGGFDFGVDANHAHVQPDGAYHYHGVPEGLMTKGKVMTLVGWAVDGFPIYARYGHTDARLNESPVTIMRSSYRLKTTPDAGRSSPGLIPMGTFTQDYQYLAGSGDLDECNGRFGVTPEFPQGIYHYYVTDTWPYVQRCVKGTSFLRDGPPPGGGPMGGPHMDGRL